MKNSILNDCVWLDDKPRKNFCTFYLTECKDQPCQIYTEREKVRKRLDDEWHRVEDERTSKS